MQPPWPQPQPAPPTHDPQRIGPAEILVPLVLSLICGIGGFGWGLVRFAQGHSKPGLVAVAINAGLWAAGLILWIVGTVVVSAMAAGSTPRP